LEVQQQPYCQAVPDTWKCASKRKAAKGKLKSGGLAEKIVKSKNDHHFREKVQVLNEKNQRVK
jgi:hypothetical protein